MKQKQTLKRMLCIVLVTAVFCGTTVHAEDTNELSRTEKIGNWFADRGDALADTVSGAGEWIGDTANKVCDVTVEGVTNAGKWIGNTAGKAWHSSVEISIDIGKWMGDKANAVWASTADARVWISEQANMVWNGAVGTVGIVGTWFGENIDTAWTSITDTANAAEEWICETAEEIKVISVDALDSTGQWIGEKGQELVFFVTSTGEVVAAYVEGIEKEEVVDYLAKSGEKLLLGEYSDEDQTLLSIGGTLAASVVNADIGMDLRDIAYDVQHLDSEDVKISDIALNAVGLIPIIGVIKPAKKILDTAEAITTVTKVVDDTADMAKAVDKIADVAEVAADSSEVADDVLDTAKVVDKVADTTDAVKDASKTVDIAADIVKSCDAVTAKTLKDLPDAVQDSFRKYDADGWKGLLDDATAGTQAGGVWHNRDKDLPQFDTKGNALTYREFDTFNKAPDVWRDAERFVVSSDGNVYYTEDHYETFILITDSIKG